jgi:hypothetical protein
MVHFTQCLFHLYNEDSLTTMKIPLVFYYWGLYDTSIVFSYNAKSSAGLSKKKEPALTFALYMRMHCWSTKASTALGHYDNEWFVFTSYNNKWCSMCILLLFLIFPFHNLPCVIFRWWSSIPLVVRYVFRVRRLLNIQMKTYHVKTKIVFFLL